MTDDTRQSDAPPGFKPLPTVLICACGATFQDWDSAHQHFIDVRGDGRTHRLEHAESKA